MRFLTILALACSAPAAEWIWSDSPDPAPKNRFTWFRKVFNVGESIPSDARLYVAADSTARVYINGATVIRKVARYNEQAITTNEIDAGPYLRRGANVIVVLHHNWGAITTFQRSGNKHAGLYVESSFINSDDTWRAITAPEFQPHERQIVGVIGDPRIRYPLIIDGRKSLRDLHSPDFDDRQWPKTVVVENGPWTDDPEPSEIPLQRETPVRPAEVLAAGTVANPAPLSADPFSMAAAIRTARCTPDAQFTARAAALVQGRPLVVDGRGGETRYITFDFHGPVHGYPYLQLDDATPGTMVDFGYAEVARMLYDGKGQVDVTGWIDPERVVGPGYSDRYIAASGAQSVEIADERTARWMALHIHFPEGGRIAIRGAGIVKSNYPIETPGSFSCGDPRIDQIIKLSLTHAEVTMTDAYIDTPGREDGQWIEDAQPRALISARWFNDTRLREHLIRLHAEAQRPDGEFHPFAPSNYPAYPAAYDWSSQWVAALYDQYVWTGDSGTIREYWDNLTRYWKAVLAHVDQQGLWRTRRVLADIRVGQHPENDRQSSGIVTPWIIERLLWSAQMAEAADEKSTAAQWRETAGRMQEAFRRFHVVRTAGLPPHVADRFDPDNQALERGYSQAGQTIAVTSGLLSREDALSDLEYAFPAPNGTPPAGVTRWNNPTYLYRSLRALSELGLSQRAVAHLIERFEPYLPGNPRNLTPPRLQGPYGGPLPEYWVSREDLALKEGQPDTAQPRDETGSHGWGAVALLWLHDSLLGITIAEPGGGRLRIAPDAAGLPYVAGSSQTPKGLVWVTYQPRQGTLDVTIPRQVTAELVPPREWAGKPIRVLRAPAKPAETGQHTFTLPAAGPYTFEVER